MDLTTLSTVRREILQAAEAQGGSQAGNRLRDAWQGKAYRTAEGIPPHPSTSSGRTETMPSTGSGRTEAVNSANDRTGARAEAATAREVSLLQPPNSPAARPQSFLMPLGVHRGGLEGAGLYGASLLSLAALSSLMAFFFPGRLRVIRGEIDSGGVRHLARLAAIGALAYGLFLLLGFFLAVLVVGSSLSTLIVLAAPPLTILGLAAVSLALGRRVTGWASARATVPMLELIAGVLVLFTASILPFAGWLFFGLAATLGMGAVVMTRLGRGDGWSLSALEQPRSG